MSCRNTKMYAYSFIYAFLFFILLSLIFTFLHFSNVTRIKADIIMRHVDNIVNVARGAAVTSSKLAGFGCTDATTPLIRLGALTPYIRSTGIIENKLIICSSITGKHPLPAQDIYGRDAPDNLINENIISVSGTALLPNHNAVFYSLPIGINKIAYAVIDSQYFTDLMDTLGDESMPHFLLTFNGGKPVTNNPTTDSFEKGFHRFFYSEKSGARLTITIPKISIFLYWIKIILITIPLSFLSSIIIISVRQFWVKKNMSLGSEINKGMLNREFSVHYQPIFNTKTGECTGAEALMRWTRSKKNSIPPDIFILAAEKENLIVPLTKHLFSILLKDVSTWEINSTFHLGINISAKHFSDPDFVNDMKLFVNSLPASICPVVEITERSLITNVENAAIQLNQLRNLGCKIAIDDFGTGYCSLSVLQSLPLDYLKVDKSFVDTILTADGDTPVLDTVIDLSSRLGLTTIAEGVSTCDQYKYLTGKQVSYVQGYLFSRPLPVLHFINWFKSQNGNDTDCKTRALDHHGFN